MIIDPNETDRVVIAGSGFGVWFRGKHQASARWSDVARVRAFRRVEAPHRRIFVGLMLKSGIEVFVHEDVPGYQSFLGAAEAALRGMVPRAKWIAEMQHPSADGLETVLYQRGPRG